MTTLNFELIAIIILMIAMGHWVLSSESDKKSVYTTEYSPKLLHIYYINQLLHGASSPDQETNIYQVS